MPRDRLDFPDTFIWGTSTGGHQVEGGNAFSDWWAWEQKGLIADGTVSGRAMDYWNRHEEDHALMAKLAYNGFRLGIEWARVEPQKDHFNYYTRASLKYDRRRGHQYWIDDTPAPAGIQVTQMGWQIYPEGLYRTIRSVWKQFGKPILITENGIADDTDEQRPCYIVEHLAQVHRALREGIPILGYFHWSFMDNFEWREGFAKRFGLVAVQHDDPDLMRAPRRSAYLYSAIAQKNAVTKEMVETYAPQAVTTVFGV